MEYIKKNRFFLFLVFLFANIAYPLFTKDPHRLELLSTFIYTFILLSGLYAFSGEYKFFKIAGGNRRYMTLRDLQPGVSKNDRQQIVLLIGSTSRSVIYSQYAFLEALSRQGHNPEYSGVNNPQGNPYSLPRSRLRMVRDISARGSGMWP